MANVDLTISSGVTVSISVGGPVMQSSNREILFNDDGTIAGDEALTWDKTAETLRLGLNTDLITSWFHGRVGQYIKQHGNINANVILNMSLSSIHLLTATGDFEMRLGNLVGGYAMSGVILLTMDGVGGHTVTLHADFNVELNGSDTIDNSAGAKNFIAFMYDGGANIYYSITNEA